MIMTWWKSNVTFDSHAAVTTEGTVEQPLTHPLHEDEKYTLEDLSMVGVVLVKIGHKSVEELGKSSRSIGLFDGRSSFATAFICV
jgi:hypothetical protein